MTRLRTISPVLAGLVALGVAAPAIASAAPIRTGASTTLVPFTSQLLHGFSDFTDLGVTDPTAPITIDITLARPDAAGEKAYEAAEYTPGNALYHQFLTPETFAAKFGVAPATYDAALAYGTAHGMTLQSATPAHDFLVFHGTTAQANATFGVHLENYSIAGTVFHANPTAALVPAALPIEGIFGLESLHRSHLTSGDAGIRKVTPDQSVCAANECLGDVTPQDVWSMYDQPSTDTGQNQKLAIFGEGKYQYLISDLRQFESENSLPQVPVSVQLADGPDTGQYTSTDGDGEWQLDTQSSTGMATGAKELDMIWGTDLNDQSTLDVLNGWVNEANGSRAASASYGECEPTAGDLGSDEAFLPASAQLEYSTDAYLISYEQGLSEAVMLGKTLFSSSGDDGSSCGALPVDLNGVANEGVPGVGYPASSPNAVGVGGTVLYGTENTLTAPASNAQRFDEYAWTYSGGGPSNVFPEPSYQSSSSAIAATSASTALAPNVPCVTNLQGTVTVPPPTCRKDPDVSAISGDILTNGYNIVDMGADTSTGGTSLSSPLTLGLWTRIESACGGNGPGFANYTFYTHPADFFDPGGLTDSTVATNGAWQSGPGYDYATGLGVIDVAKMMTDVCKTTSPGTAPTDEAAFPLTTPTTLGTAILPETAVPATLLVVAVIVGGTVLGRRRRKAARA